MFSTKVALYDGVCKDNHYIIDSLEFSNVSGVNEIW